MSTIVLFLSLEAIDIAYTDVVDPQTHVLLEEKSPNLYTVVREGIKIRTFLEQMLKLKEDEMAEEEFPQLSSPILVCLSGKSRSYAQGILEKLSPQLQKHLIYYKIDKNAYKDYPFNRAVLEGNEICYGEGFSQLRAKEEMRIALFSLLGDRVKDCIFVEKNSGELKDLKKEGYQYLMDDFNGELLYQMVHKIRQKTSLHSEELQSAQYNEMISKFDFASQYLKKFQQQYKAITLKHINPFTMSQLGIKGLISQLHRSSISYNMSPKSWVPHSSKEISAYIFHNLSDQKLYVARAVKPKDFTNEEDFEAKIFAQYVSHIIDPQAYTMPHDRHSFLMKFSKIKAYENKKAIMNIRPYVEKLVTISQLGLSGEEIGRIFRQGRLWGQKVNGIAGILLVSWLINDNLKAKSLSQQLAFLSINKMDGQISFVSSNLKESEELFICRTDFHNIFNMSNFKQPNPQLTICNNPPIKLTFDQLHPEVISEMVELIYNLRDQRMAFIRSLVLYYGWQTKLVHLYEVITYRLDLMRSMLKEQQIINVKGQLLRDHPQLASLLIPEDYSYFLLPSPNIYSPVDYTLDAPYEPGKIVQNPYLAYVSKICSFGIFNLHFPVLTYLQWLKSTSKYQIIEYISMLNNTLEGYKMMDLRLKQLVANEKKTALLIVDHVEMCEQLVEKAKSIKTVLIFRLRKTVLIQNLGIITEETKKQDDIAGSSDELIKILWREGLKQFGEDNKFELIDWILTSYVKIKCQMYDLPLHEVMTFLPILHRAISTNKHRIKEIKEIYPNQYKFLYAFPIVKESQKVQFAHHLFEFLHVKYLFANILSGTWGNRLLTYQNNSLLFCRQLIGVELAVRIVKRLLQDLRDLQAKKGELFDYEYQCGEILQLVRSLTETSRPEEEANQPYRLYFEVFPKIEKIFNFNLLKRVVQTDNCLVAEDQQAIYFYVDHSNEPIQVLQKRNSQQILSMQLGDDRVLRVLSWYNGAVFVDCYLLRSQDELEENKSYSSCSLISTIEVKHPVIEQYLLSGQEGSGEILIGWLKTCHCIILPSPLRLILLLVSPQTGETFIRTTELLSPLLKLSLHASHGQLLCVTQQSIQLFRIHPEATSEPIFTIPLHQSLPLSTKLQVGWGESGEVRVWLNQGTMLQCVALTGRGELLTRLKLEFPSPLKAFSLWGGWVLLFGEGSDRLEIYELEGSGACKWGQYYNVQANCGEVLVGRRAVYLRGGQHYLKKIQLPSLPSLPRGPP